MVDIPFQEPLTIIELIRIVSGDNFKSTAFCVYAAEDVTSISETQLCYVADYPTIENDQEVYPKYCVENKLQLIYYGDQFEDVITNLKNKNDSPSDMQYLAALNYYMDNDDFIDP